MKILGVDEAGRGPVIGPMILSGVMVDEDCDEEFRAVGIKDSKLLSKSARGRLFSYVNDHALKVKTQIVSPAEIDKAVEQNNLNWLEAIQTALIINELQPDVAYLDCPTGNIDSYTRYIKKLLTCECKIISEHKADMNYPIVAAASIIAKETREMEVQKIKDTYGVEFGSGYPSDPKTIAFIKENVSKYPEIWRKSWQTYKKAITAGNQRSLKGM
jgi:ribonuclease HII